MITFQKALENAADSMDADVSVRSYSGRAMFGKTCLSIQGDHNEVNKVIGEACAQFIRDFYWLDEDEYKSAQEQDEIADVISDAWNFRQDNMGLGVVLYWPKIQYIEEGEEADETV